ncbi:MAG: 4Fe-4S binding protein [Spirochaetes bacterium]|nr:4Fe-4S binding protein [Spirochaetota bacterium]
MNTIYSKLRERLDTYSLGFPATESGVEINILKKIFNESDAEFFMNLSPMLESADNIASRLNKPVDEIKTRLEDMSQKGLIFRQNSDGKLRYGAIPFMHGLAEFQIKRLDKEFASLLEQYFNEGFNKTIAESADLFLRVIPVQKYVDIEHRIASYEDVSAILDKTDTIVVTDCFCRKQKKIQGGGCSRHIETCFMFGSMGQYYIDNNMGRKVTKEEALKIVADAQKSGLVTQPATSQNPSGMCNCCGDCCAVLGAIKKHPNPAEIVFSNHFASISQDNCIGCEACIDICPMEAINLNNSGLAEVNLARCIGCGVCFTVCDQEAARLNAKADKDKKDVPANTRDQMIMMAKKRGLI